MSCLQSQKIINSNQIAVYVKKKTKTSFLLSIVKDYVQGLNNLTSGLSAVGAQKTKDHVLKRLLIIVRVFFENFRKLFILIYLM